MGITLVGYVVRVAAEIINFGIPFISKGVWLKIELFNSTGGKGYAGK